MLEQSTRECNAALALDPGNYTFRSCAWAFMELGKAARARDFVRLDAGSEWAAYVLPSILLREGKTAEAKEAVKQMPTAPRYHRDLLEACLQMRPPSDLDRIAQQLEANQASERVEYRNLVFRRSASRILRQEASRARPPAKCCRAELSPIPISFPTHCWPSCALDLT